MKQYDDLFDTPGDDVKAGMALQLGVESQPDQAAKDELLAKRYQLPPGLVSTYRADYENKAKFDDAMSVVEQSPKLRSWIAADPLRAKVSHDDLKSLDEAEKQYGAIKPVERSFIETFTEPVKRGYAQDDKDFARLVQKIGLDSGLDKQKAAAKAAHGMQYNPEVEQAFTLAQYQKSIERYPIPPEIAEGMREISEAEGFIDAIKAAVKNPDALLEISLQSLGRSAKTTALAAGVTVGLTATARTVGPAALTVLPFLSKKQATYMGSTAVASFFTEYFATIDEVMSSSGKDMKDPENVYQALTNPIIMDAARDKAVKRGVPIAFFDGLTAGLAGKLLLGAKPTATSVSSRVAGEFGIQALGGGAGEASAQALTGEYKPGEILLEAIAGLPTALIDVPLNYSETMTMAQQAESNAQRIEAIAQISAASKVRERDAGMFKDWIEQVTADSPVQNVYLSANVLNQSGLAQQVVDASPVVAEQYEKALEIGGEIEIPISEYMTNIAPTEASVALIDDLRVEGENMTRREATQFIDQATQEYQQLVQEQVEKQMTNDEFRKSAGEVETAMFQQIKSAGRYTDEAARIQAQFVRNFFATQATQMRMLPMDLYRASPYSVVTEGQRVFNQSLPDLTRELVQTPEFQNWFGDSVVADADGTPQLMYHGTSANITEFLAGKDGVIYVSPDTSFAQTFSRYSNERMLRDLALSLDEKPDEKMAILEPIIDDAMARGDLTSATFPYHQQLAKAGFLKDLDKFTKEYWMDRYRDLSIRDAMGSVGIGKQVTEALAAQLPTAPNILPLYVSAKNPFDYENEKHVNALTKKIIANNPDDYRSRLRKELLSDDIKKGNWKAIEGTDALDAMKELGFDSFYVSEQGVKNLGLFNSEQVKSPFNEGSWSADTANILKQSLVPEQEVTLSDEINVTTDDVSDDAAGEISQADIPTAVDDVAVLESALNVARGQTWNKGRDLKQAIQDAVQAQAQAAGVDVSVPSDQTTDYLIRVGVRDALFALQQNPNAIGWYDEKTRQALAVMSLIHPEIAKDEDAKFAFVWALAVTSNGMKVNENFKLAESAYHYYKTNKRMPTNIRAGQAQGSINKSMRLFNQLVDNWGMDNLRKFMQTNFTVGEIASINKKVKARWRTCRCHC
jgi:tetratricopeptide (TPR) repeat protein